ncbi:hypothetical protein E8E13_001153 [Curvularia kusanoi]|uniref:Uncharacterized protein n=1 Tax=Curvularia kusanoi TaxID=90978 RepID=A0A9P4T2P6_CURKU|nr:hypothetical protein E8E13_001153 [Curvularia kusanoi]
MSLIAHAQLNPTTYRHHKAKFNPNPNIAHTEAMPSAKRRLLKKQMVTLRHQKKKLQKLFWRQRILIQALRRRIHLMQAEEPHLDQARKQLIEAQKKRLRRQEKIIRRKHYAINNMRELARRMLDPQPYAGTEPQVDANDHD